VSLSGSLWADTVLGEEHSDTEGRLEEETVDMESTPLSSVEQEMVLSLALSIPRSDPGFPPSSMLDSIMSAFQPLLRRSRGRRGEETCSAQLESFTWLAGLAVTIVPLADMIFLTPSCC